MQTAVDFPQHSRTLAEFETSFLSSTGLSRDFAFGPYGAWRGALKIPGVWRSSTLLSGLVSALPLEAYRDRAGRRECIRPTPPLLAQPDARPGQNLAVTMQAWVLDYLFHGNALGIVAARSPLTGLPTAVLPVPAEWVCVGWADGSMPSELTGADRIYRIGSWEGGPWDVLHFQGPSEPGALRGLGVLESACTTFDLSRELARQASTLGQHGIPTGVLQAEDPDIGPEELASSKEDWLAAQRDRTVAALAPGVKFAPMAWNPEELQLVEARKFSLQEIALFFGLPGRYLGVESGSLQYSTPELDSVDLLKLTVNRILVAFEQEFSRHLVRGTVAIINREAILETDTKTRYETYAVGLDPVKGWLLRNEVRAYEDLEPVEGWDAPEPPAPPAPPVMGPEQGTIPGDEPMPTEDES
jgi:HK97 family phage portal protein